MPFPLAGLLAGLPWAKSSLVGGTAAAAGGTAGEAGKAAAGHAATVGRAGGTGLSLGEPATEAIVGVGATAGVLALGDCSTENNPSVKED